MDCIDNINWSSCLWFEGGSEKRNVVSGMISGFLVCKIDLANKNNLLFIILQFAVGWWLIIDAMAVHPNQVPGTYHICGLIGTFSLFM